MLVHLVDEMQHMLEDYLAFARGQWSETPEIADIGQIVAEVATAEIQVRQASDSLARWRAELAHTLGRNVAAAKASFAAGSESYVVVLDATRRLQDARLREIDLGMDLQRAVAQLDRGVGRRLTTPAGGRR